LRRRRPVRAHDALGLRYSARHGSPGQGAAALAGLLGRHQQGEPPDVCLLAMILCGTPRRKGDAVLAFRTWLHRELAYRFTNLPNDVEDITQDAMTVFLARAAELDPRDCRDWLW